MSLQMLYTCNMLLFKINKYIIREAFEISIHSRLGFLTIACRLGKYLAGDIDILLKWLLVSICSTVLYILESIWFKYES